MDVIDELIACCEAWEPWARVMGNVCAGDAAQALRSLRAELAAVRELMNCYNVGGWTDSLALMKERDEAMAELAACRDALAKVGPHYIPATSVSDEEAAEVYAAIDAARKGEEE